jgi:hypothetical protein
MSPYGRSAEGREVQMPGLGVYAELLDDTELQAVGKGKLAKGKNTRA